MRKSHLRTIFSATLLCVGISTSVAAAEPGMYLYNWFGLLAPETPKAFEQETGTRVHMDAFDSADIMQSKVMAGRTGYDVVVATSDVLPSLIQAGVLQPLDREQLSNLSHIDPDLLAQVAVNDPGNRYAVPYLWGTTGIGYDVDKVKAALGDNAPVNSWDLIFKEENISKLQSCGVAMLDSPSEIISIALHYLGLPSNSKNPDDYQKAQALLLKIRPYVLYFDSSRIDADLADGNICAVVGWANGALAAQAINEKAKTGRKITYSLPREGALVWSENLVLLKDAPHPKEGMAFINYMLRPEIIAKTSNHTLYPNANKDATAFVEQTLRDNPWIYPDKKTVATLIPLEPLPLKLERIRTRVWTKVKSGV
ncbi:MULTISPECIES: polyamine ABC transporter substrate-binding protein [Pseudomonas]|uniref:Polyamine ABC transporter substrate-binding protein n=1 Tax=Pseudomonas donghuensis TaxID=1163398 RepID=A0AAP0SLR3_9PSED|nr:MULTISPECIES: polyamine ABC transporter substrate-binding protein [Pseudomonas]MDF9892898.1 putrescine transport system substrate-binding protein [Pseudomonas vranovensis]KDO00903.2 polyamine ABC transporter substrate-binding protein [Pseudomonas donghuensis]MBF4210311.1 polyamine ABC transporter substrate-binding protein [Pseudomonas donghuensis]MBS7600553.1 polyamine ABC transporter substrate-binding protein [Pseudomonas sp. RC2C2]MCP6694166.1 polyamine ABC transporter substrate-binding p